MLIAENQLTNTQKGVKNRLRFYVRVKWTDPRMWLIFLQFFPSFFAFTLLLKHCWLGLFTICAGEGVEARHRLKMKRAWTPQRRRSLRRQVCLCPFHLCVCGDWPAWKYLTGHKIWCCRLSLCVTRHKKFLLRKWKAHWVGLVGQS